jgi:hypothetical protein
MLNGERRNDMWLVMDIGCIECGVSSKIVGVFADKAKADEIAAACCKTHYWRDGGQNAFEVFEIPAPEVMDAEYLTSEASLQ